MKDPTDAGLAPDDGADGSDARTEQTFDERVAAVRAILAASRKLQRAAATDAPWVGELARVTGLGAAGVRLGLSHLETEATEADLASLLANAGSTTCVHVILSANVFVAVVRALALARAASSRVVLRPSKREPLFARLLVAALADASVTVTEELDLGAIASGEVHVYGRDETIADVRAAVGAAVRVRGHGAGMGVAVVGVRDGLESAAKALVRDVVPFDQRGCLSPRVAVILGDVRRARRFARHVHDALIEAERVTPRGALDAHESEALTWYRETVSFGGELHEGDAHVVGTSDRLLVPPPGRHLHVVHVEDTIALKEALGPVAAAVAAVGIDDLSLTMALPAHARVSPLGRMQRPPLDGPVDRRSDR